MYFFDLFSRRNVIAKNVTHIDCKSHLKKLN
jgi:hypothetical protein